MYGQEWSAPAKFGGVACGKVRTNMKKIYEMVDGMPLYKHLKNNSEENEMILGEQDYGKFAEFLGKKKINYLVKKGGILEDIFPGICFASINKIMSKRKTAYGTQIGDTSYELSYQNGDKYGKKIVVFEIKYGMSHIKQYQIRRYCGMIDKPEEYFPKADEVKVIFVFFNKIDTINRSASYQICELDKELVNKILQSEEQNEIKMTT